MKLTKDIHPIIETASVETEGSQVITNEHLLQAFSAAGADDGIVYMSTSITSGRRLFELSKSTGIAPEDLQSQQPEAWKNEVLDPNLQEAKVNAKFLRTMHQDKIVVDPSMIEVKGWQQFDYNSFWVNLISTFPTILVATPNWEYSRGARYEVSHALSHHIEILQLDGSIITQTDAESQARKAIDFLIEQGLGGQEVEYCLPPLRDPPEQTMSAASQCFEWLVREREYQVNKFGTDLDDEHSLQGFGDDSWWWQQLTNYYHRSKVLGVDTPGGRQAIAKFSATSCGLLESVIRIYGPLPQPGVSSGEIQW